MWICDLWICQLCRLFFPQDIDASANAQLESGTTVQDSWWQSDVFFLNISFWLMFSFMLSCYNFQYAYEIVCYTANCAMSQTWWHVRRVLTVQPYWGYDLKSFKLFFLLSLHKIELQLQFITSFKCQLKIVYTSYIAPVHLKNGLSNKTYELTRH